MKHVKTRAPLEMEYRTGRAERREKKRRIRMKVSGKGVLRLARIIVDTATARSVNPEQRRRIDKKH